MMARRVRVDPPLWTREALKFSRRFHTISKVSQPALICPYMARGEESSGERSRNTPDTHHRSCASTSALHNRERTNETAPKQRLRRRKRERRLKAVLGRR